MTNGKGLPLVIVASSGMPSLVARNLIASRISYTGSVLASQLSGWMARFAVVLPIVDTYDTFK